MHLKIKVFVKIINLFFTNYTEKSKLFKDFISKYFSKIPKSNKYILVDYFESYEAMISRSYFLNIFCKKNNCAPLIFSDRKNIIFNSKWKKIYKSLGYIKLKYIFYDLLFLKIKFNFLKKNKHKKNIKKFFNQIKDSYELTEFEYLGIKIGRDIIDEYLYMEKKHTVNLTDKNLKKLILNFLDVMDYWFLFFQRTKTEAILLSHINVRLLAIVGKIATKYYNIPVYSFNCRFMRKNLKLDDHFKYIQEDYEHVKKSFNQLELKQKHTGIEWAKNQLSKRFNGEVGVDMFYSNESAFHNKKQNRVLNSDNKIKALICTHEFYDNPHAYGGLLFSDFYEWLLFIAKKTLNSNFDWYIKNHPDVDKNTKKIIENFAKKHPHIKIINEKVSFFQLRDEGLKFIFTCYGSIAYEAPLLGINVINADINNPVSAYDFTYTPKDLNELEYYIGNLDKLEKKYDYNQIYEYYFSSKKLLLNDDLIFNSYSDAKRKEKNGEDILKIFLEETNKNKHDGIIKKLSQKI